MPKRNTPKLIGTEVPPTQDGAPTTTTTTSVIGGLSEPSSIEKGKEGGNGCPMGVPGESPTSPVPSSPAAEWLGDSMDVRATTTVSSAADFLRTDNQPDGLSEPSSSTATVTTLTVPSGLLQAKLELTDTAYDVYDSDEEDEGVAFHKIHERGRPLMRDHDSDDDQPVRRVVLMNDDYVQPGVKSRIGSIESNRVRSESENARAVLVPNATKRASTPRGSGEQLGGLNEPSDASRPRCSITGRDYPMERGTSNPTRSAAPPAVVRKRSTSATNRPEFKDMDMLQKYTILNAEKVAARKAMKAAAAPVLPSGSRQRVLSPTGFQSTSPRGTSPRPPGMGAMPDGSAVTMAAAAPVAASPRAKTKTRFVGQGWTPTLVASTISGASSAAAPPWATASAAQFPPAAGTAASSSSVAADDLMCGPCIAEEPVLSAYRGCYFPSNKLTANFLLNLPELLHVAPYSDRLVRHWRMMPNAAHPTGVSRIGDLRWCEYCNWMGRMMAAAGSANQDNAIGGWQNGDEHFGNP